MTDIHTLERLLRRLRLFQIASDWHSHEKHALAEGWTPSRYLLSLCSKEASIVKRNGCAVILRMLGYPQANRSSATTSNKFSS